MIRLKPSLVLGQAAPDFQLSDGQGITRKKSDFAGRWLVLFFYPADFTPGCTVESCGFRDHYQDFKDAGAEVVGVSADNAASHKGFAKEHRLPYLLLSDPDAVMRRAYTVPHFFGRLSGRTTFVIDPGGFVKYVFDSRSQPLDHITRSLEFIKRGN